MLRLFLGPLFGLLNMASTNLSDRLEKINSLKNFINSVQERVKEIANELNWTYESLVEEAKSMTVPCSVHPEHKVSSSRISEHEQKCNWVKDGYHPDDLPFPEDHGQGSHVVFTPEIQETVIRKACSQEQGQSTGKQNMRKVPQTSARLEQDFTREEKLAMYDYVIANTKSQNLYNEIAALSFKEEKNEEKVMTRLELAAAERDAKRRRASYRNKVHTNRKTQTEILREVIDSQMEALKEQIPDPNCRNKDYREQQNVQSRIESDNSWRTESSKGEYVEQEYYGNDKSYKKSYKCNDQRKHTSDRDSKHKHDSEYRISKHKSKKHKRSRSRSLSYERSKEKKSKYSDHFSSHKSSYRH